MGKQKTLWECQKCGHTQGRWTGVCSSCQQWNTFTEQIVQAIKSKRFAIQKADAKPKPLTEIKKNPFARMSSNMPALDNLLGGGIVVGSLILIGGAPGIGKSTLLLQISQTLAKGGKKVLYICGEESVEQIALRAKRLHIEEKNIILFAETSFAAIKQQIEVIKPDLVMVDSIQILYKPELSSMPGSISQVRDITMELMHIAKGYGITIFLIGHVTKGGDLAGPKVLEHLVDTVLDFEGEKKEGFRLLRSVKNRFGPAEEIALFQMQEQGLVPLINPSSAFLQQGKKLPGTAIIPTVEGGRALLVEAQALVTSSFFPTPARRCSGLDPNRLALLLAVLEKRVGYHLHRHDVFVSLAGGIKIVEPSIDLGVIAAVASSFANRLIDNKTVVLGEVGLGGEVRGVSRIESRLKEASHMGFKKALIPKCNFKEVKKNLLEKLQIIPVDVVDHAIRELIG